MLMKRPLWFIVISGGMGKITATIHQECLI